MIEKNNYDARGGAGLFTLLIGSFAPAISTILVEKFIYKNDKISFKDYFYNKTFFQQLKKNKKTLLVSWFLPTLLHGAAIPIALYLYPNQYKLKDNFINDDKFRYTLLASLLLPPILSAQAMGEEIGWRSYLYDLYRKTGFWTYSIFICGIPWGIFHFPVCICKFYAYPDNPILGCIHQTIQTILLSPVFTELTDYGSDNNGKIAECGSNLANPWFASILHVGVNLAMEIPPTVLEGGNPLISPSTGNSAWIAYSIALAGLCAFRFLKGSPP